MRISVSMCVTGVCAHACAENSVWQVIRPNGLLYLRHQDIIFSFSRHNITRRTSAIINFLSSLRAYTTRMVLSRRTRFVASPIFRVDLAVTCEFVTIFVKKKKSHFYYVLTDNTHRETLQFIILRVL